jgi:thiamine biosynthesis lipoprotein
MMSMLRRPARAIVAALTAGVLVSCAAERPERQTVEFRGPTMGAEFAVKVVTGPDGLDEVSRTDLGRIIRAELDGIDARMSTWKPDSELSRFNASTSLDPFAVSRDTFEVFQWAVELGALTGGALDVTIAPLVDAWGFGPGGPLERQPTDADIQRLLQATGVRHLALDAQTVTVRKMRPDVRCDFSSIAPGYAADRIWTLLAERGFSDYLVDVGGELRTRGRNDAGAPWQIAIELPQPGGRTIDRILPLSDLAIATSGDYRNYHEVEGRRVTHIIDPRTGAPIQHRLASVTVIDELAVRADALSTALMVLGPEAGPAFAREQALAAAFIIRDADGEGFLRETTSELDALAGPRPAPLPTRTQDP